MAIISFGLQSMYASDLTATLQWQTGLDMEHTDGYLQETQSVPATGAPATVATIPLGKHYDYQVSAKLLSPYVQFKWHVTDSNQLSFGIRYETLEYDYDNRMRNGRVKEDGSVCVPGCRFNRPADRSDGLRQRVGAARLDSRYRRRAAGVREPCQRIPCARYERGLSPAGHAKRCRPRFRGNGQHRTWLSCEPRSHQLCGSHVLHGQRERDLPGQQPHQHQRCAHETSRDRIQYRDRPEFAMDADVRRQLRPSTPTKAT